MKKKILFAGILLTAGVTNVALANYQPEAIGADEKPPIVIQVEEHEERIGTLETRTDDLEEQVSTNTEQIIVNRDRVVHVENKVAEQPKPAPNPAPEPKPEPINPYKVIKFERIYHTEGQYPLLKCIYHTYNGEIWWHAARSKYVKDEPCQVDNPSVLTENLRVNLTNRPIDVF